jgi:hypothetical protein
MSSIPDPVVFNYLSGIMDDINNHISPAIREYVCQNPTSSGGPKDVLGPADVANLLREHDSTGIFHPCARTDLCVYKKTYGHTAISYLSPKEYENAFENKCVPATPRPCYMCFLSINELKHTRKASNTISFSLSSYEIPFYHKVNQPGGYKMEAIIGGLTEASLSTIPPSTMSLQVTETFDTPSMGFVFPIRHYRPVNEYTLKTKTIEVHRGVYKSLFTLIEDKELFYTEPSTTKDSLRKVGPYFYFEHTVDKIPTTFEILTFIFSPNNHKSQIGLARIRSINNKKSNFVTVMAYMGWRDQRHFHHGKPRGFTPFPFEHIFCPDIAQTEQNLEKLLEGGRIHLGYLDDNANSILNYRVDFESPLSVFSDQVKDKPLDFRLKVAWVLRARTLESLMVMYPNTTEDHDSIVHPRLKIFQAWQIEQYCNGTKLATPSEFNPIQHISFAYDHDFVKITRTPVTRNLPMDFCCEHYPEFDWLFVDFKELRDLVRADMLPREVISKYWNMTKEEGMVYDLAGHVTGMSHIETICRNYSILWSLHARLNVAIRLEKEESDKMNEMSPEDPQYSLLRDKVYNLRLFTYTHLSIVQRILDYQIFSDAKLSSPITHLPSSNFSNVLLTHYEDTYPYSFSCPHEGLLPDLTSVLSFVNFFNCYNVELNYNSGKVSASVSETSDASNNVEYTYLFNLFRRLSPHISQKDNAIAIHNEGLANNISYLHFSRIVFTIFCLGAYRHARKRPSFSRALEIFKYLSTNFEAAQFTELQKSVPRAALLSMAELVVFYTRLNPVYRDHIISEMPEWKTHEDNVLNHADSVRERWGINGEKFETACNNINHIFPPSPRDIKSCIFGEGKIEPIRLICGIIKQMDILYPKEEESIPHNIKMFILHSIRKIPPGHYVNATFMLDSFNLGIEGRPIVSMNTIVRVYRLIKYAVRQRQNFIIPFMALLKPIPPKEWSIVKLYFYFLSSHLAVKVYDMDSAMKESHEKAIIKRYGELSPYCSSMIYSLCCNRVCTFNSHDYIHTFMGHNDICISRETNDIRCNSNLQHNKIRCAKRSEKGIYNSLMNSMQKDDYQKLTKVFSTVISKRAGDSSKKDSYSERPKCHDIPLLIIPLPGRVIEVTYTKNAELTTGNRAHSTATTVFNTPRVVSRTVCTHCGSMCGFSTKLFGPNGYVCGTCTKVQCMMFMTPFCSACSLHLDMKRKIWPFYVIDDRPGWGTMNFRFMYICARCKSTKNSRFHPEWIDTWSRLKSCKHSKNCQSSFLNYVRGIVNLSDPQKCTSFLLDQHEKQLKPKFKRPRRR